MNRDCTATSIYEGPSDHSNAQQLSDGNCPPPGGGGGVARESAITLMYNNLCIVLHSLICIYAEPATRAIHNNGLGGN